MIKGSIHQEHNSLVYVTNNRASEYMKQKLIEVKGEKQKQNNHSL